MVAEFRAGPSIQDISGARLMAITDLASLRTAAKEWADYDNISDERLNECVQLTTSVFNNGSGDIPALRMRDMEAVVTLTPDANYACALPSDYLQYRRVIATVVLRNPLEYITPFKVDELYPQHESGCPNYFTIIGSSLYMFPTTSSDIELTYYQKIADLQNDSDTNWLLTKAPSLYLHGTLLHLGLFSRDDALMQRSGSILASLVDGLRGTDMMSEYSYAPGFPRGITIA